MGRSKSIIRQGDIQRGLKAAKAAGLDVVRYEVDPSTGKMVFVVKENGNEAKVTVNPWNNAATPWSSRKGRK
jgi:hypothetical protein